LKFNIVSRDALQCNVCGVIRPTLLLFYIFRIVPLLNGKVSVHPDLFLHIRSAIHASPSSLAVKTAEHVMIVKM